MELPALLKPDLAFLEEVHSEDALMDTLSKDSRQMADFFEAAGRDQTWSSHHSELMERLIVHFSRLFLEENLSLELAQKVGSVIHSHTAFLLPKTPRDLIVHLKEGVFEVNALLFSLLAPSFTQLALSSLKKDHLHEIHLPKVQKETFEVMKNTFEEGKVGELWRLEQPVLLDVYLFSIEWEIEELEKEAAYTLKRYITPQNFKEILIQTLQKGWQAYYEEVLDSANSYDLGVIFHEMPVEFLKIEFLDYRESAMDLFEALKTWITHLGFFGAITDDPRFSLIINETPHLKGISLNETKIFTDRLLDIPNSIEELDLSMNPWLTNEHLKTLLKERLQIKHLSLKSSVNIDFKGFGILKTLPDLEVLLLTKCFQIRDEDLLLICQCAPKITHLDLEGCERLTDRSLDAIGKFLTHLEELNLSRLSITDGALIDLCHRLKRLHSLNLERCFALSDKSLLEGIARSYSIRKIHLNHTSITPDAKARLIKIRPSIKLS